MDYNLISIPLEVRLNSEIFSILQGDVLMEVMNTGLTEHTDNRYQQFLQGHSFQVTADLAPGLFGVFQEVTEILDFNDPIEFYINNSPELNAFAFSPYDHATPHIVNINSGLIQALNNRELRFVIGHELGHIISRNNILDNLIRFVYPNNNRIPILLRHKISLWQKLAELTADRYGYIACNDLSSAISAFFKISSGLDTERVQFNYKAYLEENQKLLDNFINAVTGNVVSHPVNPVRIKAIELFSQSVLMKNIFKDRKVKADEELNAKIDEICKSLLIISNSPLDHHRKIFIATAGIIVSTVDKEMNEEENNIIFETLSQFTVFPVEFLDSILRSNKAHDLFIEAIQQIMSYNPAEKYAMIDMMFSIIHSDHKIHKSEIEFLYTIGTNLLGMSVKEIAQVITGNLQNTFLPKLFHEIE